MAQYQRFLSYLFEYDGDEKKENCGFAKVEIRGDIQRISLSLHNQAQAEVLYVFGFYRRDTGCGCVPLGRMVVKNGRGQLQYVNSGPYLAGSRIRFEQLSGLVAGRQQPFSNAYATVWDDQFFGLSLFAEKPSQETETVNREEAQTPETKEAQEIEAEQKSEAVQEIEAEQELETCELESGEGSVTEQAESDGPQVNPADGIWEKLSAAYPHIETLPGDKIVCLKAMPADIGRLPRQNWVLSSNGFLMYSFVKHRYIVFARVTDGHYELWVPGNYDRSEEFMAQMFGFYRFRSVKSMKAGNGDFGYWCVPLTFPT